MSCKSIGSLLLLMTILIAGCGGEDANTGTTKAPTGSRSLTVQSISPGNIQLQIKHNPKDWIMIGRLDGVGNYGTSCDGSSTDLSITYADGAVAADFGTQKIGPGKMPGLVLLTDKPDMKPGPDSILLGHRTAEGKRYEWGVRVISEPDRKNQKTFR